MTTLRRTAALALALGVAVFLPGCAPKPPALVPVEGTVYLDGEPLPLAQIEFVPELKDFGAEYTSTAVTDEKGHFVLQCSLGQPGAAVATHRVVVTEHVPDEIRTNQTKQAEYLAKQKNRPIPDQYGVLVKSPLRVEVKSGQATYDLQLKRQ
jgi:hypothetical protein